MFFHGYLTTHSPERVLRKELCTAIEIRTQNKGAENLCDPISLSQPKNTDKLPQLREGANECSSMRMQMFDWNPLDKVCDSFRDDADQGVEYHHRVLELNPKSGEDQKKMQLDLKISCAKD